MIHKIGLIGKSKSVYFEKWHLKQLFVFLLELKPPPKNRHYITHYLEENWSTVENFSRKLGIVRDPFNNKDYNGNYGEKNVKYISILGEQVSQKL